jgi:hypothetical protein
VDIAAAHIAPIQKINDEDSSDQFLAWLCGIRAAIVERPSDSVIASQSGDAGFALRRNVRSRQYGTRALVQRRASQAADEDGID